MTYFQGTWRAKYVQLSMTTRKTHPLHAVSLPSHQEKKTPSQGKNHNLQTSPLWDILPKEATKKLTRWMTHAPWSCISHASDSGRDLFNSPSSPTFPPGPRAGWWSRLSSPISPIAAFPQHTLPSLSYQHQSLHQLEHHKQHPVNHRTA